MADREQPIVQVNVRPPQADNLRLSQPGEQVNDEKSLEAIPFDSLQKPTDIIIHNRGKVWELDFRQLDMIRRVVFDDLCRHGLIQSLVQNPVD